MSPRQIVWLQALRALFAIEAASLALILPRIPDIRDALALTPSALGLALLGLPLGSLVGFLVAPRVVQRIGSARGAWLSVAAATLAFVPVALAGTLPLLLAALFLAGLAIAHTEIALNAQASHVERQSRRRVMSGCHGFWSLGSIGGVLTGGLCAQAGLPVALQAGLTAVLLVPLTVWLGSSLLDGPRPRPPRLSVILPSKALLPLCLLPVGVMAIEGIYMDWSALFLTDALRVEPFAASLGYLGFSIAMAVGRLVGDRVTVRLGPLRHAVASACLAGVGTAVFATAGGLAWAVTGASLAGLGAASLYPIALSLAGERNGPTEENIAAVSFTAFLLLLAAPVGFGLAVDALDWRGAFLAAAGLALPTLALAWCLGNETAHPRRTDAGSRGAK